MPNDPIANASEFVEEIRRVRQARLYRPDPVPPEVLDQLLEVARWTGSARNTQPWRFVVITDREQLRAISRIRTPINWVADVPLAVALVMEGANPLSEAYDEGRVTERIMIAARLLGLGGGIAWFGDEADPDADSVRDDGPAPEGPGPAPAPLRTSASSSLTRSLSSSNSASYSSSSSS